MTIKTRKRVQLAIAIGVLAGSGTLLWFTDSALTVQHQILDGCWPQKVYFNGHAVLTSNFWLDYVAKQDLPPIPEFFHTRIRHRILLYLLAFCAAVGWSGSIFLRIAAADENAKGVTRKVPSWEGFVASLLLSGLGGIILFLLFISSRLMLDRDGMACVSEAYGYAAAAGAIMCGLFVVVFFRALEPRAKFLWKWLTGATS